MNFFDFFCIMFYIFNPILLLNEFNKNLDTHGHVKRHVELFEDEFLSHNFVSIISRSSYL